MRADVSNTQAVSFPGYTGGSIFQLRRGESLKKFIIVDDGIRTHDSKKKKNGLPTTPVVKELVGY